MSDDRDDLWRDAVAGEVRKLTALEATTAAEVERLVGVALTRIRAVLAGTPSEWQAHLLPALEESLKRAVADLRDDLVDAATAAQDDAWKVGVATIEVPAAAAIGLDLAVVLPQIDTAQLMAMKTFTTGRMNDVAAEAISRINTALAMASMGVQTPAEAVSQITEILEAGSRRRAQTIVRTEMGRAFSHAAQQRMEQAVEILPGLRKQWRRSGKVHSRVTHDAADGQIRKVDEPFIISGVKLRYPRDPAAPLNHTVNCGCISLPLMTDWEVVNPGRRAFTKNEKAASEWKRRLDGVHANAFASWARKIGIGKLKPAGHWEPIGHLTPSLREALNARGLSPISDELAISDRRIAHLLRKTKNDAGKAIPAREVPAFPRHVEAPKAVLFDRRERSLIYVFEVFGEDRLGKLVVQLGVTDKARHARHNWVKTAGLVARHNLAAASVYDVLFGEI